MAPPAAPSQSRSEPTDKYLPYGVPVPAGTIITKSPEPYDPAKHGEPRPNSIKTGRPQPASRRVYREARQRAGLPVPAPVAGSSASAYSEEYVWGLGNSFVRFDGLIGWQDVQLNVSLPAGYTTNLYAPTNLAGPDACVEQTIEHRRTNAQSSTTHYFGVWNWCDPAQQQQWWVSEEMDAEWRAKYVGLAFQGGWEGLAEEMIFVQIERQMNYAPNCWRVLLYNFQSGWWEAKTGYLCGTSYANVTHGWTMWEMETDYPIYTAGCPSIPSIRMTNIEVKPRDAWNWTAFTSQHSYNANIWGLCFQGAYSFESQYYPNPRGSAYWWARTPGSS